MNRTGLTNHAAVELLADVSIELARAPADIEAILVVATSRLSRLRPATWVAAVINPNPETYRILVADHPDREMARYVEDYVAAIDGPQRVPMAGLSRQVIESGSPIVIQGLSFEEFLLMLPPAGQDYCRRNPPPRDVRSIGVLIVPMRVGGATVGTLTMLDAHDRHFADDGEVGWLQLVADRIALSVEHARLAGSALIHAGEMELVQSIALAHHHCRDLRVTMGLIVDRLIALPDIDAADVMLLSEDGKETIVAASAGFRSPWPPEHRVDAGWAALEQQRAQITYWADLELKVHNPRRSQFMREGFQTFATIALHGATGPVGVLNLYGRGVVDWEQNRLEFLETLGGLVAMAIDQASPTAAKGPRPTTRPAFSDLEVQILRLVADGFTNRQIAEQVYRSENTVKFHVRRLLERSEVANRTELVRLATRDGWV